MTSAQPDAYEGAFAAAARDLASHHALAAGPPRAMVSWGARSALRGWVESVREAMGEAESDVAKAAEWWLDNDYVVHRAILQITEDLPPGFYARLPALVTPEGTGEPRIADIGRALLSNSRLQLSLDKVTHFVEVYQEQCPLTIGELWALPTVLRLACVETLVSAIARLIPELDTPFDPRPLEGPAAGLDETEQVARALGNLRIVSSIPWKDFFQRTSRIEAMLRADPAGVYGAMDFETCDDYRRVVEELAHRSPHSELEVAERAIGFAQRGAAPAARRNHVGFWLVDQGRIEFERSLDYRVPPKERVRRLLRRNAGACYATALAAATLVALLLPDFYLRSHAAGASIWALGMLVSFVPASVLAVTAVQWLATRLVPPKLLPKLDFERGIPADCRTAVVMPALAGSRTEALRLLERMEGHYLANPDASAEFVLLSDFTDAQQEVCAGDDVIVETLTEGVERLNEKYGGDRSGHFHVLHRERRFNPAEAVWMGRERKRGKLEDFNRMVLGARSDAFPIRAGEPDGLEGIRFVVTLDADTDLPRGSLARLVGTLAHPLNRAEFDPKSGRVVAGYTVVQPRVEINPESGNRSRFARWFAGDTAIDIYSRAVSDVYQDLFGTGSYVGKGIYDVGAFHRSLEGRVPENALASHDLFEGIHGRAALATDIVLYEAFPSRYLEFTRRTHRWMRGDWQLLPWLGRRVPDAHGQRIPNRLLLFDRWRIADNLRRSLVPPSLVAMLAAGWLILPGSPWLWTLLGLAAPAGHLFTDLVTGLGRGRRRSAVRSVFRRIADHGGRWALLIVFLPFEAYVALNAIVITLVRLGITRRGLLRWTTSDRTARELAGSGKRARVWREMWVAPVLALALGGGVLWIRPDASFACAPLILAWLVSPEIALLLAAPLSPRRGRTALSRSDRAFLGQLARRTWLYFETFAGPEDQWLPPDNFQEEPGGVVAHRTSPTNIGMLLLSTLAARDLGYLGTAGFVSRLTNTLDSMKRLERYRGHLFNWYDTRSLTALEPRYVSTVDSGNLAASLLAVVEGCREVAREGPCRPQRWDGLLDVVRVLNDVIEPSGSGPFAAVLRDRFAAIEERVIEVRGATQQWWPTLEFLIEEEIPALDRAIMEALEEVGNHLDPEMLHQMRVWLDRVHQHLRALHRDLRDEMPWLAVLECVPTTLAQLGHEIAKRLADAASSSALEAACSASVELLERSETEAGGRSAVEREWTEELRAALVAGPVQQRALQAELEAVALESESAALAMDFQLLYDRETRLFYIGFNASANQLDSHHYDLLASEARIASMVALAKGDVPIEHWFHLGRPITRTSSGLCLLSWGGSMFEYLMPSLLLRSEESTLLARSACAAVDVQRRYASDRGVPWGTSESGYADLDADRNYRYRAFGVPGLGLRRGLEEDLVVAPYASALALRCAPAESVANLRNLERLGMMGEYGLYEAADFTGERLPEGREFVPVHSYMAHHQGMILAALDNALCEDALVRRVHSDRRIQSVELLLHERVPTERPPEELPAVAQPQAARVASGLPRAAPWRPIVRGAFPELQVLGNGRFASWITDAGGGGLQRGEAALTRFVPDTTLDASGIWIYLQDEQTGALWSATRQPTGAVPDESQVVFHPHLAEFHRRDHGISLRMEVAVAPADDVEIRRVTLVNESDRRRVVSLTSYGEVVLARSRDHERHPAFSKLFVWSEWNAEHQALLFSRRVRDISERSPVLLHRVVAQDSGVQVVGFETDRATFVGRGRHARRPALHVRSAGESTGWTLDPIFALRARVELEPNESQTFAFITLASGSRESAIETAERFQTLAALDWVLADSATEVTRELQRLGLPGHQLPHVQSLGSLLQFPHRNLGGDAQTVAANRLGQPRLWGLGISGDLPIVLLRTESPDREGPLQELVRAHQWWRQRGMAVDLVVLRAGASGYAEPIGDRLAEILRELGAHDQLGRRGGIHYLIADQLPDADRKLLEVCARIQLGSETSSLSSAIENVHAEPPALPRLTLSASRPEATTPLAPTQGLQFDNGLGGFSPDGSEYVISLDTGESTPAPWCNILANDEFGTLVSESGGGFTWAVNSGEHRLTPWSNDPVSDSCGEGFFLRDEETGEVWSPSPGPARADARYEIRHGIGYTDWRCHAFGLEHDMRVGVAPDAPVKWIRLRLHNQWSRPRRLTATYYVEWVLGTTRETSAPHVVPEYHAECRAILARNPWSPEFSERVAFLTASRNPHGLTADRSEFLGREGDPRRPEGLVRWGLSGRVEASGDPCAALQVHLELRAGEDIEVVFALGEGRDREHAVDLAGEWRDPGRARRAEAETRDFWDAQLGSVQVETPDPATNLMLNRWLLYQALSSRVLARTGFYQSGGAIGFRDQLQDLLAVVHSDPDRLREHLLSCAAHQFEEGDVLHWWHPPSGRGVRTRCSDDLLWLPFAVAHYVHATGDSEILDAEIPLLRAAPLDPEETDRYAVFEHGPESRSLFEHCERALERGLTSGAHGLPLIAAGDWNDGMNRVGFEGRGESIWLAWFAISAMDGFAALCARRGDPELEAHWRSRSKELARAAEEHGWDGAWYRRAYDDAGRPWGSAENDECRIDSVAQSWAALSGAGNAAHIEQALASAESELVRGDERLVSLLWPPFASTLRDPGYIKAYPPGVRENGGQYSHAAVWLGWAFAKIGDGARAARIFDLLNPIQQSRSREDALRYRLEPYVLAADIAATPPHVGRGGWSWYTGSAAWLWRLGVEGILGLQAQEGGLRIDPCLPPHWPEAAATLRRPNGTLAIRIDNSDGCGHGVAEILVDGETHSGETVSFPEDGSIRRVEVRLGRDVE